MVRAPKLLHITDRAAWRAWLRKHHSTENEIWLVYHKKHTGKPRIPYVDAVEEALCFGWIDSTVKRLDGARYIQKYTPRKNKSVWSELNKKRAEKMIKLGRMTEAGLAKIKDAKQSGEWSRPQTTEASNEVPPELRKALAANKEARLSFENLAPSYRRQFLGWLMSAKREDTRRRRISEIVRLLSEGKKLGMR